MLGEKKNKLDGNYKRMLSAVLKKKSRKQLPTKLKLFGHLFLISQIIQDEKDMLAAAEEIRMNS